MFNSCPSSPSIKLCCGNILTSDWAFGWKGGCQLVWACPGELSSTYLLLEGRRLWASPWVSLCPMYLEDNQRTILGGPGMPLPGAEGMWAAEARRLLQDNIAWGGGGAVFWGQWNIELRGALKKRKSSLLSWVSLVPELKWWVHARWRVAMLKI